MSRLQNRFAELKAENRAALVTFGHRLDLSAWSDRVQNLDATYAGSWELPALGAVAAPAAVRSYPDALSSNRSSSSSLLTLYLLCSGWLLVM